MRFVSDTRLVLELPRSLLDAPSISGEFPGGADVLPMQGRCETDPEMYRIFAHAVLGWHRRLPRAGGDLCQCGKPWEGCEYVNLADDLLWTATGPVRPPG